MPTPKKRNASHTSAPGKRSNARAARRTEEQTPTIEEIEQMYRVEHPDWPERDIRMATLVAYTDQLDHVDRMNDQERRLAYHDVVPTGIFVDE